MKSELIVDVQPDDVSIALLEDSRLVSLQKEARNTAYAVGDIYIAKVRKLMPGLNAAFVNVGYEKDAFLHYLDLGPRFATYKEFMSQLMSDKNKTPDISDFKILPDIDKHGSVTQQLEQGQELMVQIVKEPISSKGPRLTTEISFTGRYMVLRPFYDKISISQKIKSNEEKSRLRQLIASIKPKNFGVIIRTSAEGKRVAELINEMKTLLRYWDETCAKCRKNTVPSLVFEEESRIVGMLRDVFTPSFEAIHVNNAEIAEQIRNYVSFIAPDRTDIVKTYSKPEPIFDTFGITRQIKSSFGKTVSFKSGAYIIIEHTEALHVIDVNSGNRTKADSDQETNALEVNLRAADEIARQLRLRDMGGIIVVDFIDMATGEHRQQLYEHMRQVMANDRARHNILPLSKFGLMQITRQRVRPALDITTDESCPSCHGEGRVQPSLLFTDTLYDKLEYVCHTLNLNNFILYVHPFVDAYIKKGWLMSLGAKWKRQLGRSFRIIADQSLAYLEYRVIDKEGNILDLKEEKDTDRSSRAKLRDKTAKRILDTYGEDTDVPLPTKAETPKESGEEKETTAIQPQPTPPSENGKKAQNRRRREAARKAAEQESEENEAVQSSNDVSANPEEELLEQAKPKKKSSKKSAPKKEIKETPEADTLKENNTPAKDDKETVKTKAVKKPKETKEKPQNTKNKDSEATETPVEKKTKAPARRPSNRKKAAPAPDAKSEPERGETKLVNVPPCPILEMGRDTYSSLYNTTKPRLKGAVV